MEALSGCAICFGETPDGHLAGKGANHVADAFRDSHFRVSIRRCPECSQSFANIFYETITFSDHGDRQDWLDVPLTTTEVDTLMAAGKRGENAIEAALRALPPRRYHHSSAGDRGHFSVRSVIVLQHD